MSCDTCTYAYHAKCLLPPLKAPPSSNWRCPECVCFHLILRTVIIFVDLVTVISMRLLEINLFFVCRLAR